MQKIHGECWVITNGTAGNNRQALALAAQLPLPIRHLVLTAKIPWRWFAPHLLPGARLALTPAQRAVFMPPWPTLAIGCGRMAAFYTRLLGRLAKPPCYTIQILNPRMATRHWHQVIAPQHDRLSGSNVLQTIGSLNPVDDAWLAHGRHAFPTLAQLPRPRLGVLLGGPCHGITFDRGYITQLRQQLRARQRQEGGSLLLLASRRTPPMLATALHRSLADLPGLYWGSPADGPNPYAGVLGWADHLVVTPDSVNMLSEACATGRTVYTMVERALPARLQRFHSLLRTSGRLHDLADLQAPLHQPVLRETAAIASTVLTQLAAHQNA